MTHQKGEAINCFAFLRNVNTMLRPKIKSVFTFTSLFSPVIFLGIFSFYLNQTQPVVLTVAGMTTNNLPSKVGEINMQMIVFLDHPQGKSPEWWGQPMNSQSQVMADFQSSNNHLFLGADVNPCSYDKNRKQYRVPVHCVVPSSGRWKQQATLSFQIKLKQARRQKGVVKVELPWPLSS